jgi:hypothetical protein
MEDLEINLKNQPGALALLGEVLGKHQISLEGGGVFPMGDSSIAHFLVIEGDRARQLLWEAGIDVVRINRVLIQKLRQDLPGQLGLFCRRMAEAGVNILVQYSDHANQLIIVPDDFDKALPVSEAWTREHGE